MVVDVDGRHAAGRFSELEEVARGELAVEGTGPEVAEEVLVGGAGVDLEVGPDLAAERREVGVGRREAVEDGVSAVHVGDAERGRALQEGLGGIGAPRPEHDLDAAARGEQGPDGVHRAVDFVSRRQRFVARGNGVRVGVGRAVGGDGAGFPVMGVAGAVAGRANVGQTEDGAGDRLQLGLAEDLTGDHRDRGRQRGLAEHFVADHLGGVRPAGLGGDVGEAVPVDMGVEDPSAVDGGGVQPGLAVEVEGPAQQPERVHLPAQPVAHGVHVHQVIPVEDDGALGSDRADVAGFAVVLALQLEEDRVSGIAVLGLAVDAQRRVPVFLEPGRVVAFRDGDRPRIAQEVEFDL
ncbi:hypothetical protein D3C87_1240810 [compost metagenome]